MHTPWYIDATIEAALREDEDETILELERRWNAGQLASAWYQLVLAVGISVYHFHDYEVAIAVCRPLLQSRYRMQTAMFMAEIYEMYPVDASFLPILHESRSPVALHSIAKYYDLEKNSAAALDFARASLRYKPIANNLRILIRKDHSLDREARQRLIDLWEQGTNYEYQKPLPHTSVRIYCDFWNEFILGRHMYENTRASLLQGLKATLKASLGRGDG